MTVSTDTISCPNCLKGAMQTFYEARNIPVHSVLLMETREKALVYPRRDLTLGFCPDCGFIANTIFDPSVHEYSTSCEESQGCSPTFSAFARSLAGRWVEQYDLTGKSILEIGCGKGEFLVEMVEHGMSRGIGIDPAYIPGRLADKAVDKIEFIQDFYGERYAHLTADVICCRHTLEHIAPTHPFMEMVRATIGDRSDTLLLFELPDVHRVLKEAAFWDIYYEHCSYFTCGSLARLFRQTGFDLLELDLEFDGQYIVIAGKPSVDANQPHLPLENDMPQLAEDVKCFPARFAAARENWLTTINGMADSGRTVVLWGGGSKAVAFLAALGLNEQIHSVVDINPHKHGKFIPGSGHQVRNPADLKEIQPDCVILMNPVYQTEVQEMLDGMGLSPEILPV